MAAQSRERSITISPTIGYEDGLLLDIRRDTGLINRFGAEGKGESRKITAWLGSEITIPELLPHVDAILRIRLGAASGSFVSRPFGPRPGVDPATQSFITTQNEFRIKSRQNIVQADVLVAHRLPGEIILAAGPWASLRISSSMVETEHIVTPSHAHFQDVASNERVIATGDVIESSPIRYGVLGGIGYDIDIGSLFSLRPMVASRCDLDALNMNLGLRAFSLDLGLTVSILSSADTTTAAPPMIDTVAIMANRSSIMASVDLFNLDSTGSDPDVAVIKTQHTIHRQYVPLVPVVLFDDGSDTLSWRYQQQQNEANLRSKNLSPPPVDLLQSNILNVLGKRLQDMPGARVLLQGVVPPGESPERAKGRAESVASYLHTFWKIPYSQISIESTTNAGCGLSRETGKNIVAISVTPSTVLAPSFMQWMIQDYVIPNIGVNKKVNSTLGVKEWELTIWQGSYAVANFSQDHEISGEFNAVFPIANFALDSLGLPLTAELRIVDHIGKEAIARDKLYVRVFDSTQENDREIRTYAFLESDGDCPELNEANQALIANIASATRSDARIIVLSAGAGGRGEWGQLKIAEKIAAALDAHSIVPREIRILTGETEPEEKSSREMEHLAARVVNVMVEQRAGPSR